MAIKLTYIGHFNISKTVGSIWVYVKVFEIVNFGNVTYVTTQHSVTYVTIIPTIFPF